MGFHTLQMSFILTSPNIFTDNVTHSQNHTDQQKWKNIASEIPEALSTTPRAIHCPGHTDKSDPESTNRNQLIHQQ